jgi:glucokinase
MNIYAAGIDIGGTNTKAGIVSDKGDIIDRRSFPTADFKTLKEYKSFLSSIVNEMCRKNKVTLSGIGIGAPNGNYYTGKIEYAPNLPWKGILDITTDLVPGIRGVLTNDANAAAIGEKKFGKASEYTDFIVVTLGTGIGGGIFINSEILYGKYGFAGEIGHIIAVSEGRKCNCGRKGCIERYASATGFVETAKEILERNSSGSILSQLDQKNLSGKDIYEAALLEDKTALDIFNYTAKLLASFFADLVHIFSPEAIIVAGGLAKSGDLLLDPVRKYFKEETLEIYKNHNVEITTSTLPEQDAAILGAASLVL